MKERFYRFMAGKGFYIALFACVIAIGVTGYYLLSMNKPGAVTEPTSVSEPVPVQTLPPPVPSVPEAAESLQPAVETGKPERFVVREEVTVESGWVWPVSGQLLQSYSAEAPVFSATLSDWRVHTGVDIAAALGTPVQAVAAGTVSTVYDDDLMGATVVVTHEDGLSSVYSNLQELPAVKTGDTLRAGDIVGVVGATALAEIGEAPHLHLEVLRDGVSVDPAEVLPDGSGG